MKKIKFNSEQNDSSFTEIDRYIIGGILTSRNLCNKKKCHNSHNSRLIGLNEGSFYAELIFRFFKIRFTRFLFGNFEHKDSPRSC